MTQIMVEGSQGAHLVQDSLTGVSSKGKAIPSSDLELRHLDTSVTLEAKSCSLAGLAAPQPFAGLWGSSSPAGLPLPGRECLNASARASTELCPGSGAAAEQPSPLASAGQQAQTWSPAPQQVSLFICAPRTISKLVLNAVKPSASGHTKEIHVITSNTK